MNRQTRRDVRRVTRERFRLWAKDSMELYEMADLPIAVATADILEIVTGTVINAVLWLNMKPEAAVQRLYDILKEAQQEKEDERGRT